MRHRLSVVAALLVAANAPAQQPPPPQPAFTFQEVMIPVRDGVHLQTAILTPTDKTGPLPILFRRTPYGVRRNRIGRGPVLSVGVRIAVCRCTPSRTGIITSWKVKAGWGGGGCCAGALAATSRAATTERRWRIPSS